MQGLGFRVTSNFKHLLWRAGWREREREGEKKKHRVRASQREREGGRDGDEERAE